MIQMLINVLESMSTWKERADWVGSKVYVISPTFIHCLKQVDDKVIVWMSPEWISEQLWHHIRLLGGETENALNVAIKSKVQHPSKQLLKPRNLSPISHVPSLLAAGTDLSVQSHWEPLFSPGLEEEEQCYLGDCFSVMPRCFRTILWCLVAPTTTETSPEVKLWSKRKLWRNFYLICIPLFHLHIHPAQSASLLATSTCFKKKSKK